MADGQSIRRLEVEAPIAGSVAVAGGQGYFGHYGNAFVAADLCSGKRQWTYRDKDFPYFGSPAVSDRFIVFGGRDRRLHCVLRTDGSSVWTFATRGKIDASPVICRDKVIVGSADGRLYLLDLASGEPLWEYEIGDEIVASPAVVKGLIVIGAADGQIYAFSEAD